MLSPLGSALHTLTKQHGHPVYSMHMCLCRTYSESLASLYTGKQHCPVQVAANLRSQVHVVLFVLQVVQTHLDSL